MHDNLEQRLRALEAKLLINQRDSWTRVLLGRVLLQAGRVEEAEAAFQKVIADEPKNPDGHHGLGRVRAAQGNGRTALQLFQKALDLEPNHVGAHAEFVAHHEGREDHVAARPHYHAILRTRGEDPEWLRRAAMNLLAIGDDASAVSLLERLRMKLPEDQDVTLLLGLAYSRLERPVEARDLLEPLCRPSDCSVLALTGLGLAWLQMSEWEEARAVSRRALEKRPTEEAARLHLMRAELELGAFAEVVNEFHRLSEPTRASAQAANLAGQALLGLTRPVECLKLLAALAARPDATAELLCTVGRAEVEQGRPGEAAAFFERALRLTPEDVELWRLLGRARAALEHHSAASDCFVRATTLRPSDAELHFERGRHEQLNGSLSQALASFERGLELCDTNALAQLHAAECAIRLEKPEQALRFLEEATSLEPELALAHKLLGRLRLDLGRLPEASSALEEARRQLPDDLELCEWLGGCLSALGRFDRACAVLEDGFAQDPNNLVVARLLGRASEKLGRHERAALVLRAATKLVTDDPELWMELGHVEELVGEEQAARACFERARGLDRSLFSAAFRLGKVCLLLGDYAAARTALLASEQLEPADKSTPILLGRVLTLLGDFAEAESRLTRAAREAPHDHEIAFLLARAVFELGDARRARGELDRALSLGRRDASTQLLSGLIYERLSDLARAAEALRSAVQLEPSDLAGHRALLRVTLAAERWDEAVRAAREALRLAPGDLPLSEQLALALEASGRDREAKELWLSLLVEHPERVVLLARLGLLHHRLGEYEEASERLRLAVEHEPKREELWDALAEAERRLGHPENLARILTEALTHHPVHRRWNEELGLVEMQLGHEPLAIAALTRAVELGSSRPECEEALGRLHFSAARRSVSTEQFVQARRSFELARIWLKDAPDLLLEQARCLLELRELAEAKPLLETLCRLKPTEIEVRLLLGRLLLELAERDAAIAVYREVTRLSPSSVEGWQELGRALASEGRRRDAISTLNQACALAPESHDLAFLLGQLLLEEQCWKEARPILAKVAEARPLDFAAQVAHANCLIELGDDAGARLALERALRQRPTEPVVLKRLGEVLTRLEEYQEALAPLATLSELGDTTSPTQRLLGFAAYRVGQHGLAVDALRLARSSTRDDELELALLDCLVKEQRWEEARGLGLEILEVRPDCLTALEQLGEIELGRLDPDAALLTYSRILRLDSQHKLAISEVVRLRNLRAERQMASDPEAAEADLVAALTVTPKDVELWQKLARLREARGLFAEALDAAARALELDSDHCEATQLRARLLERAGLLRDARDGFTRALELDPNHLPSWMSLGSLEERLLQPSSAKAAYARVTALDPNNLSAWESLARLALELEQPKERAEALTAARALRTFSAEELRELGKLWYSLDAFDRAEPIFRELLVKLPSDEELLLLSAEALQRSGREQESAAVLARLLRVAPHHPLGLPRLGLVLCRLGQHEEAMPVLEKARAVLGDSPELLAALSQCYRALERPEPELGVLEALVGLGLSDADLYQRMGLLRERLGQFAAAQEALVAAHEKRAEPALARRIAEGYLAAEASAPDPEAGLAALGQARAYAGSDGAVLRVLAERYRARGALESACEAARAATQLHDGVDEGVLLGEILLSLGRLTEALVVFEQVLDQQMDALPALIGAGTAHMELGHDERAESLLRQAVRLAPERVELQARLSTLLGRGHRLDEALSLQRRVAADHPTDLLSQLTLAELLLERGELDEMLSVLSRAQRLEPTSLRVDELLRAALEQLQRFGELLPVAERLLAAKPTELDLGLLRARCLFELGRLTEARLALEPLWGANPDSKPTAALLALTCERQAELCQRSGEHAEAAEALSRAVLVEPPNLTRLLALARSLAESNQLSAAQSAAVRAVELSPEPEARLVLGAVEARLGRFRQAADTYCAVLDADRHNLRAWSGLGLALGELGRDEEAIDALTRAIEILPEPATCLMLAQISARLGRDTDTVESLTRLSRLRELEYAELLMLGRAEEARGRHLEASQAYSDAHLEKPDDNDTLIALGRVLLLAHQPEAAIMPLEKVRRSEPSHPLVDLLLTQAHFLTGRYAEAIDCGERQLARGWDRATAERVAEACAALGRDQDRARILRASAEHQGDDPEAQLALAEAQSKSGDRRSAIASARRAFDLSGQTRGKEVLGALLLEEAVACVEGGARDQALLHLDQARAVSLDQPGFLLLLAHHYHRLGELEQVLRTLEPGRSFAEREAEAQALVGTVHAKSGRLPEAIGAYRKAIADPKAPASLFVELGRAESALGEHESAQEHLLEALNRSPDDPELAALLLESLANHGDEPTRLRRLEVYLRLRPQDRRGLELLARCWLSGGQHQQIVRVLGAVTAEEPSSPELHYLLAAAQLALGENAQAKRSAELALGGSVPGAERVLGLALSRLGRPDEAIEALERALARQASPELAGELATLHRQRAEQSAALGELESAQAAYRRVLELEPQRLDVRIAAASALARLGRTEQALAILEPCQEPILENQSVFALRGKLELALGRPSAAEAAFRTALQLSPSDTEVRAQLGIALSRLGRSSEALEFLDRAEATSAPDLAALEERARLLEAKGDAAGAATELSELGKQRALSADEQRRLARLWATLGRDRDAFPVFLGLFEFDPSNLEVLVALAEVATRLAEHATAEKALVRATEVAPERAELWRKLGEAQSRAGQPGQALLAFDRALAAGDQSLELLDAVISAADAAKNQTRRLEALRARTRLLPQRAVFFAELGEALLELGSTEQAEGAYQSAVALERRPNWLRQLARCAELLQKPSQRIELLAEVASLLPGDAQAQAEHGLVRAEARHDEAALHALETALRLDPGLSAAQETLALVARRHARKLLASGAERDALSLFEAAAQHVPPNVDDLYDHASCQSRLGGAKEAIAILERARALDPSQLRVAILLASLYGRTGQRELSRVVCQSALVHHPRSVELSLILAEELTERGELEEAARTLASAYLGHETDIALAEQYTLALVRIGRGAEAAEVAARALGADPNSVILNKQLGLERAGSGRHAEAAGYFEAALRGDAADPTLGFLLARSLAAAGESARAIAVLRWCGEQHPSQSSLFELLVTVAQSAHDLEAAIHGYQNLVRLHPNHAQHRLVLGQCYVAARRHQLALGEYHALAQLDPRMAAVLEPLLRGMPPS